MKLLIVPASLGITGAVIVFPTAATSHVRLANSDLPRPDRNLGRRLPMKTFIVAALLAVTAVSGVVAVTQPAAAHANGTSSGNPGGGHR